MLPLVKTTTEVTAKKQKSTTSRRDALGHMHFSQGTAKPFVDINSEMNCVVIVLHS